MAGPVGGIVGGVLGAMGGGAITAQTPAERQETAGYAMMAAKTYGEYNLALYRMNMMFVGSLANMALQYKLNSN